MKKFVGLQGVVDNYYEAPPVNFGVPPPVWGKACLNVERNKI